MALNTLTTLQPELFSPVFTDLYMKRSIAFARTQTLVGEVVQYGKSVSIPKLTASNWDDNSGHALDGTDFALSTVTTGEDVLNIDQNPIYVWMLYKHLARQIRPETLSNLLTNVQTDILTNIIASTEAYTLSVLDNAAGAVDGGGELDATVGGELTEAVVREIESKFVDIDADEYVRDNLSGSEVINQIVLIGKDQYAQFKKNDLFVQLDQGGNNALMRNENRYVGARYELGVIGSTLFVFSAYVDAYNTANKDGKNLAYGYTFDSVMKAFNNRDDLVGSGPSPMAMAPMINVESSKELDIRKQGYLWSFDIMYGMKAVRNGNIFRIRFEAA